MLFLNGIVKDSFAVQGLQFCQFLFRCRGELCVLKKLQKGVYEEREQDIMVPQSKL